MPIEKLVEEHPRDQHKDFEESDDIDATGLVCMPGAFIAKNLPGEEVKIVNAEKTLILAEKRSSRITARQGRVAIKREDHASLPARDDPQEDGAWHASLQMRRGRDAFSKLRIYGHSKRVHGMELTQPDAAKMRTESNNKYIELGALSKRLGANF